MFHCDDVDTDSVLTSVRVRLALLVRTRPTADMVVALDAIDASRLGPIDAVTYLQALSRVSSWLASRRNNALVAAASPTRQVEECRLIQPDNDDERRILIADVAREEIAAALRLSPATAQRQMDAARLLAGPLSDTAAALARGEISQSHADVLVEHAGRLPGAAAVLCGDGSVLERKGFERSCATLQSRVLPTARASTVSRTRAQANRVILAIDAEGVQRRRRAAMCTRDVYVSDQLDGISVLMARMATEQAHALLGVLDVAARAAQARAGNDDARAWASAASTCCSTQCSTPPVNLAMAVRHRSRRTSTSSSTCPRSWHFARRAAVPREPVAPRPARHRCAGPGSSRRWLFGSCWRTLKSPSPCDAWSVTRSRATCSTTGAAPTPFRTACVTSSSPATPPAGSLAAIVEPTAARSTMRGPGTTADRPIRPILGPCASATIS